MTNKSARRRQVKPMSGRRDKARAGQDAVGIKAHRLFDEIIVRISINERRDIQPRPALPRDR